MDRRQGLTDFFREYARLSLGSDPEPIAERYDTSFLAAGPKGAAAFANDDAFLAWLREVHAFNRTAGMTSMSVAEVSARRLSDAYTLADVSWAATFERTGDSPIPFTISYLLRETESGPRIVAYISHEDQEEAMRSAGLL